MQLLNVPAFTIEGAQALPSDHILVSIQEESGPAPKIGHIRIPVYITRFSDIEHISEAGEFDNINPITLDQAKAILDFVDRHHEANTCVVHCAAGVSRSASVALGLHYARGFALPKRFFEMSLPKPRMTGMFLLADKAIKRELGEETGESKRDAIMEARVWAGR